jgi:hypothetical protein
MPTSIANFMTQAEQKQFARDFLFRVKQVSVTGLSLNGETDLIYARTATFPGRNIENKQVKFSGQNFNVPGVSNYPGSEAWSLEFYVDQNLEIRDKLEAASRTLFDNETTTGNICMPGYESVIVLDVLQIPCSRGPNVTSGNGLQVGKTIELVGASLRDIGEISYQIAEGTGEILTFTTTFAFHFYKNYLNA